MSEDARRRAQPPGPSEAEVIGTGFLCGLPGVTLVMADDREGSRAGATQVFVATSQRRRMGPLRTPDLGRGRVPRRAA